MPREAKSLGFAVILLVAGCFGEPPGPEAAADAPTREPPARDALCPPGAECGEETLRPHDQPDRPPPEELPLVPACASDTLAAPAADPVDLPPVAGTVSLGVVSVHGGTVRSVAADGDVAWVGVGEAIVAVDLADPEKPVVWGGTTTLGGTAEDIAVAEDVAVVAAGSAGLVVLDVGDPRAPRVVGRADTFGYAAGVALDAGIAYVADGVGGLRVLDVSSPEDPLELARVAEGTLTFDVVVRDGTALVAALDSLIVVDVSSPASPAVMGRVAIEGFAEGVAIVDDTAIVAARWGGLVAVDVSDPDRPLRVSSTATPGWAMDVVDAGAHLVVADAYGGLVVVERDPARMRVVGSYAPRNAHAGHLALLGGLVLVADHEHGLHVVDVSAPDSPRRLSGFSPLADARAIQVEGGRAVVAAQRHGLHFLDVTDPRAPRTVARVPSSSASGMGSVHVAGGLAYGGAHDVSLATTLAGALVAAWRTGAGEEHNGPPRGGVVRGNLLYQADEWGLDVFALAGAQTCHLSELVTFGDPPAGFPESETVTVDVRNDAAFLAGRGGLTIVDVSRPGSLKPLSHYADLGGIGDVRVLGDTAFVSMIDAVVALDVSDPRRPVPLGLPLAFPTNLASLGGVQQKALAYGVGRLFVAAGSAGLYAVDVSDPSDLRVAGHVDLPGSAISVTASGDLVYVALASGGIAIVAPGGTISQNEDAPRGSPALSGDVLPASLQDPASPKFGAPERVPRTPCTVRTTASAGDGSMRDCVDRANGGGVDAIRFDAGAFPPHEARAISIENVGLARDVTLDGTGSNVILSGGGTGIGIKIAAEGRSRGVIVRNLTVRGFDVGLSVDGAHHTIENVTVYGSASFDLRINSQFSLYRGNRIGLDPTGASPPRDVYWAFGAQNLIEDNEFGGGLSIGPDPPGGHNEVLRNRIHGPFGVGAVPFQRFERNEVLGATDVRADDVFMRENTFHHAAPHVGGSIVRIGEGSRFVLFGPGNTVRGGGSAVGISLGGAASDVVIVGNEIDGARPGSLQCGICVEAAWSSVIEGNSVSGVNFTSVRLDAAATGIWVRGNDLRVLDGRAIDAGSGNRWLANRWPGTASTGYAVPPNGYDPAPAPA